MAAVWRRRPLWRIRMFHCLLLIAVQLSQQPQPCNGFSGMPTTRRRRSSSSSMTLMGMSKSTAATTTMETTTPKDVALIQASIEGCIAAGTDPEQWIVELENVFLLRKQQRQEQQKFIKNEEEEDPRPVYEEPNRCRSFFGEWHVWYTNCPPPSNGQLGPFRGTARQVVDCNTKSTFKSYQNILEVPPNDWLTATLDGVWEEWDGKILEITETTTTIKEENDGGKNDCMDWGATCWRVTFLELRIALQLFGNRWTLLKNKFPPNTSRVWRTTYLDPDIRIVRAGKTGRREDEVVFYTKRTPPPPL